MTAKIGVWMLAAFLAVGSPAAAAVESAGAYRIAIDDVLDVAVQDHPDLTVSVTVISDGTVTLPLVGAVKVAGLTADEAAARLRELYDSRYVTDPTVGVNLKRGHVRQFFVNGEVKTPGAYPYTEGITVLRAVIVAGGFTEYAAKGRVKVLRKNDGPEQAITVNAGKIEGGAIAEDRLLEPEDIVVVPERFL